jgi:hypothetical protein
MKNILVLVCVLIPIFYLVHGQSETNDPETIEENVSTITLETLTKFKEETTTKIISQENTTQEVSTVEIPLTNTFLSTEVAATIQTKITTDLTISENTDDVIFETTTNQVNSEIKTQVVDTMESQTSTIQTIESTKDFSIESTTTAISTTISINNSESSTIKILETLITNSTTSEIKTTSEPTQTFISTKINTTSASNTFFNSQLLLYIGIGSIALLVFIILIVGILFLINKKSKSKIGNYGSEDDYETDSV